LQKIFTRTKASLAGLALLLACGSASANPAIIVDVSSGETLYRQDATRAWYPASLTKLMTAFVALKAVRENRITLNTPLAVSARAARMAPSKMGFKPGTLVTLDNALKMLMVKSANDIAVSIAEGVSGSVEAFADEMNSAAASIGMRESHFVNPNGLPDARQVSSARDMAVLGRALYAYFPEQADLFSIGALRLGAKIIPTHNGMLGRYPGADGMKTGFTCAAGFNLVASATQNGRRLIVVVLGAPSAKTRTMQAASLLDKAFSGNVSREGAALSLASAGGMAPDMRDDVCRNRGKAIAQFSAEIEDMSAPIPSFFGQAHDPAGQSIYGAAPMAGVAPVSAAAQVAALPRPYFEPVPVFIGPVAGWTGPIARATGDRTPASKQAYAADKDEAADDPLKPAPDAQSLRGKKARAHAKAIAHAKPAPAKVVAAKHGKTTAVAKAKTEHKGAGKVAAKPAPHGKTAKVAAKPKPAADAGDE
jgi:D-alanyl-D-alanine carboxypeptidase